MKKNWTALFNSIRMSATDAQVLKLRQVIHAPVVERMHEATQGRRLMLNQLTEFVENGLVAIVEGGMDCDCSAYEGHVHLCKAAPQELDKAIEEMYLNAEGPIHWEIMRPSESSRVKRSSVDLALRAFEDGHAHLVYL